MQPSFHVLELLSVAILRSWIRPWVEGFVVREASRIASNWRSEEALDAYLRRWNIPAIEHIDTRALVRHIRDKGAMRACL